uniref:Uncharacterized protein n=1 Tax=Anguilla anguilla TaxID=7936 RepID=A0A0E9RSA0_ANGAN
MAVLHLESKLSPLTSMPHWLPFSFHCRRSLVQKHLSRQCLPR